VELKAPDQRVACCYTDHVKFKEATGVIGVKEKYIWGEDPSGAHHAYPLLYLLDQLQKGQLARFVKDEIKNLEAERWLSDPVTRQAVFNQVPINDREVYECRQDHPVAMQFKEILGATLGIRRPKDRIFELVLFLVDGQPVPFPNWSDGQKAVFSLLLIAHYGEPEILLIDELENHLHPQLASAVIRWLKETVPQTFIATHHPHLIFSRYVDKVFYLERDFKAGPQRSMVSSFPKQPTPSRRLKTLSDSFESLSAAYSLFDHQDHQLLLQAQRISSSFEVRFYSELIMAFRQQPVGPKPSLLPDKQTQSIATLIDVPTKAEVLRVLDIGSGLGRVQSEYHKLKPYGLSKRIEWTCVEPDPEYREVLENLDLGDTKVTIVDDLKAVSGNYDFILAANVVHELTPPELTILLIRARELLSGGGRLLVGELHPLLHAERFAVPYSDSDILDLFGLFGCTTAIRDVRVHDATAYVLSAKFPASLPEALEITKQIISRWSIIEGRALSHVAGREHFADYVDYKGTLIALTTIASVNAFKRGHWRKDP
jgi:hypothetical protein